MNSGDIIQVGPNKITVEGAPRLNLTPAPPSETAPEAIHDHESSVSGFDGSCFEIDEAETYDGETVALLRAEIEHLQAALARRDAEQATCQFRSGQPVLFRGPNVGFRCCIGADVLPLPADHPNPVSNSTE